MIEVKFSPGIDQVVSRINSLPPVLKDEVLDEVGEYGLSVLRKEPRQKYVTRKAAYGKTFFTDRQRRWFFWALSNGNINVPYRRTGSMSASWRMTRSENSVRYSNAAPGVNFVMGAEQSRHEKMVGWKKADDTIASQLTFRSSKFRTAVSRAYQAAIRKIKIGQD